MKAIGLLIDEEWVKIPGSMGQYEINTKGEVRNAKTGNMLKLYVRNNGTTQVYLSGVMDGSHTIGQLMSAAFFGGKKIRRKDGDVRNNNLENLEVAE